MFLSPEQYAQTPVFDLLKAAGLGMVGIDQRWLHAIVDRGPEAVIPDILRYSAESHEDEPITLDEDLVAICHYFGSPLALPFLIHYVRESPDEVSDELVETFHRIGRPSVDPLLALFDELGEEEGGEILFLLASLQIHDDRVFAHLKEYLDYDLGDGAFRLGLYGDPAAKPLLEARLADLDPQDAELAPLRRDLNDALTQLAEPPTPLESVAPFDLWTLYPEKADPPFDALDEPVLLSFLEHPHAEYRQQAAASFKNVDLSDTEVEKLRAVARNDADPLVRARAWEALGLGTDNRDIDQELRARLEDPSTPKEECAGLIVGLAVEATDPPILRHIQELYDDPAFRPKAMEAMRRSMNKQFREFFPKHLDDPNEDIKRESIAGVGFLGITSSLGRLEQFFKDEDFRDEALFAYSLGAPTEVSPARVTSLLKKIDTLAGGLSPRETELVQIALDQRLMLNGKEPIFFPVDEEEDGEDIDLDEVFADEPDKPLAAAVVPKVGRNDPCPCGSGRKYKKCHGQ